MTWLALSLLACNGDDTTTTDTTTPTGDTGPELVQDVFTQTLITPIDILMVVDPGWDEPMDEIDDIMARAYETLLLADPNWRIGVLDPTRDPTTPGFGLIGAKFETWPPPANAFDLGNGGGEARVRQAVYTALELRREQDANVEFLRSDAHLYILAFTNQEDGSAKTVTDPEGTEIDISKPAFTKWLRELQPSDSKRLGALTDSDHKNHWEQNAIDGVVFDAGSFRAGIETLFLDAIGQKTAFTLSETPADPPQTVTVIVREQPTEYAINLDYTYDPVTNTIAFVEYVPPPGAQVVVEYMLEGATPTTPTTTGGTTTTPTTP